jgi:3-oxoacyl-[acyl-carrier-protein] synthase II
MRNRVCITGMGVVCSAGGDCESFGRALAMGKPCFSRITHPKLSHLKAKYAGFIPDFKFIPGSTFNFPWLDRFHQLAITAAGQALTNALLSPLSLPAARIGVLVGTCSGPMLSIERSYERRQADTGENSPEKLFVKRYDGCAKLLACAFGISGVSATVVTACSASLAAIGIASDLIRLGVADAMLVGGGDTISPTTLAGFDGLKATAETACAPFSKPFGLSLGEAAAFLVVERMEHAISRGAPISAEIVGFGLSNDAYHCTSPDPTGAGQALAMERALKDAGLTPQSIVYINAHGTGTEANDKTETKAIKRVFGEHSSSLPVSSTKSMVGHCLGAAGCLETIATIVAHQKGVYPPTAGFSTAREGCTLDYIPDTGRKWTSTGPVITNNFAFGGNNASLALYPSFNVHRNVPDRSVIEPVVITACGIVSAAGIGKEPFIAALRGAPVIKNLSNTQGAMTVGAIADFDMKQIDRRIDARHMDKSSKFATAAARIALQDTVYFNKASQRGTVGLYLHCATGSTKAESEYIPALLAGNFHMQQVSSFPYVVPNSITGNVCKALMLTGHNLTFCLGPGAGLMGLGFSWHSIRNGHSPALLSGSVDELLEQTSTNVLTAHQAQPGYRPPSEGACVFMLETQSHAHNRNALILGEISAIAHSTDCRHVMSPDSTIANLQATIHQVLRDAGITPANIGAIGYNTGNPREKEALTSIMANNAIMEIDVSQSLGYAPATAPLFNIAYGLFNSSFETDASKNYILAVFSSDLGANCAALIRKNSRIKE